MKTYKEILKRRAKALRSAQPATPEKALDYIQLKNRDNLRAWREKLREHGRA
jgi:recombinational DNA repair ATPase RecF